ncbi:MAG: hypothetical protein QM820_63770 [Minicystis sp.]
MIWPAKTLARIAFTFVFALPALAAAAPNQSLGSANASVCPPQSNPLSTFATPLPHTTQPKLPQSEKTELAAYLDHPDDASLTASLAFRHVPKSLLHKTPPQKRGEALKHTLFVLYFLNRTRDLDPSTAPWVTPLLEETQAAVDQIFLGTQPITLDEFHDAHLFFRETFHLNQEQNRYDALDALLQDFTQEPRNVYSSFAITAINLWIGGEANFDDPTTLYNFILGSYFSLNTIDLAHELELAWDVDPVNVTRFRMAATLGGFSLLQRRWLAKVHHDDAAVALIDDEHRLWREIQPAFHAFTFALPFFDEPQLFLEGLAGYADGFAFCNIVPVRTCLDQPRFPFNLLAFSLGFVDYLLKAGDLATAEQFLTFNQAPSQVENFSQWTLGRDAWNHRIDNAAAIMALYLNADPCDDPINFETTRRKWGEATTTCQECHETQAKPQTVFDINGPQNPPASADREHRQLAARDHRLVRRRPEPLTAQGRSLLRAFSPLPTSGSCVRVSSTAST